MGADPDLRGLEEEFRRIPYAKAAVLFGSAARGDALGSSSDKDVIVFLEGKFVTPNESYLALAKLGSEYDITPSSVYDVSSPISDMHSPRFYEHFIGNHKVIFDDSRIVGRLRKNRGIRQRVAGRLGISEVDFAEISYNVLKGRRNCVKLCRWVPPLYRACDAGEVRGEAGQAVMEMIYDVITSYKSAAQGIMRGALHMKDALPDKEDYKEVIISRFIKHFPKFWLDKREFKIREYGFVVDESNAFSVVNEANPFIASHLIQSAFAKLEDEKPEVVVELANEARKLIEFDALCVNENLMNRLR